MDGVGEDAAGEVEGVGAALVVWVGTTGVSGLIASDVFAMKKCDQKWRDDNDVDPRSAGVEGDAAEAGFTTTGDGELSWEAAARCATFWRLYRKPRRANIFGMF